MPLVTLPRILLRAPLLPLAALRDPVAALLADELGARAAADVPPDALPRYARRAAFRPTPRGLWAGAATGTLGAKTSIATGPRRAVDATSFAGRAGALREALEDPGVRHRSHLRRAPSLLRRGDACVWLAMTADGAEQREAELDDLLGAILDATADWIPWPERFDSNLLLDLVDDGLLHARGIDLGELPADVVSLVHEPRAATLDAAVVARAAAVAPVLFRLQAALAPPAHERDLDDDLHRALGAIAETFGAGAIDLAALALGDYGVRPPTGERRPRAPSPPPALVGLLLAALREGGDEIALDPDALDAALPPAAPPPSFELFLTPARRHPWLLGLHAPAGATTGRFGLSPELPPDHVDVAFVPSAPLGDLAPPPRAGALALTHWPETDAITPADLRLVVGDGPLRLIDREGRTVVPSPHSRIRSTTAPRGVYQLLAGWSLIRQHAPWAFTGGAIFAGLSSTPRVTVDGFVIAPRGWAVPSDLAAPRRLARWRKEAGVPRHVQVGLEDELMLVDLDTPGAAAEVARLARDGARAWEVWPPLDDVVDTGGRRVECVVNVVDRPEEAPRAKAKGRRAASDEAPPPRPVLDVPPPVDQAPSPWHTVELYGDAVRQDRVLLGAVAPAIAEGRAAGELGGWFFIRYVDALGRPHLRVRLRGKLDAAERRLRRHLAPAFAAGDVVDIRVAPYFREEARYGGAASLDAWERLFEAESDATLRLLEAFDPGVDPIVSVVAALERVARTVGLDDEARHALARRLRDATSGAPGVSGASQASGASGSSSSDADAEAAAAASAADYRRLMRPIAATLEAVAAKPYDLGHAPPPPDAVDAALHMTVNRVAAADAEVEARAYYLWERALDGLRARRRRK